MYNTTTTILFCTYYLHIEITKIVSTMQFVTKIIQIRVHHIKFLKTVHLGKFFAKFHFR